MTFANNMRRIDTRTISTSGVNVITFDNIPQTYTDLYLMISARSSRNSGAASNMSLRFNSASSGYGDKSIYSNIITTPTVSTDNYTAYGYAGVISQDNDTANSFGTSIIRIPSYTSSNQKNWLVDSAQINGTVNPYIALASGLWSNTAAITRIDITIEQGAFNFIAGSSATLYGTFSGTAGAKATGGFISSDANYYYHTFTASGTFTPTQSITAECIVVAGGGGGGSRRGGGGGAGGFIYVGGQGLSAQNYTVTVGAGGTGGLQSDPWYGTNGSNSSISGITTATGGGYGRGDGRGDGASGGSGGGGSSGNGGSPVSNQGNSGGSGSNSAPNYGGGGGGGAGSAGQNGTSTTGGNGGAGTSTYSSWRIGQDINGTYWLAGGGGGGTYNGGVAGNGGAGGGGNASIANSDATASSGLPNTGGGGGGNSITVAGNTGNGGAGGSGIVIIRYPK